MDKQIPSMPKMVKIDYLPHEQKKGIYQLLLDDELICEFDPKIMPINWLKNLPVFSDKKEFLSVWKEQEEKGAKSYALKRLSKKNTSSKELLKLLDKHLVSEKAANKLIQTFQEKALLNDQDWIEGYIRQGIARRLSPRMMAEKLKVKGFRREEILEALEQFYPEKTKKQILAGLMEKEINRLKGEDTPASRKKIIARLARRGFSLQDIYDLLG